jgi:ATP-dependent DNA ligase
MRINDNRKGFTNFLPAVKVISASTDKIPNKKEENYHSDLGIVKNTAKVFNHLDPKISKLAGETVKILPETKEAAYFQGKFIGYRVQVIPLQSTKVNLEPVSILLEHIITDDKTIKELQRMRGKK